MKKISAKEAARLMRELTKPEKARVDAYLRNDNRFDLAARELGIDRQTVAATWKRVCPWYNAIALGVLNNELTAEDLEGF